MKKSRKEKKREEDERKEEERKLREEEEINFEFMTEEKFRRTYNYEDHPTPSFWKKMKMSLTFTKGTFFRLFPSAQWLIHYKFKQDIIGDVVAGITVAVMHIPHGLAYAPLAHVRPVVGFYMAIFPVLIYFLMGTSRHLSIGTFAVMCAMAGHVVTDFFKGELPDVYSKHGHPPNTTSHPGYTPGSVISSLSLLVGLWQTLLGLLSIGSLTVIMSESLISGFTTGAAFHVLSYQFKHILGLHSRSFEGAFRLLYTYMDIFQKISSTNLITLWMSIITITILLLNNYVLKPFLIKKAPKCKFPVPIELIVILAGILSSNFLELYDNYNVPVVGNIPTGFPSPVIPPPEIMLHLLLNSMVLALVAIATNMSLAKMFAKKKNYFIDSNQELVAYGLANIFGAFFVCVPTAASLSRSAIQYNVGGKTQLASFFSLIIITCILLSAGVFFEETPYCVLSSIVCVSLIGLLGQFKDLPRIFRRSFSDGVIWVGTCLCVIIIDLEIGLLFGLVLSAIRVAFHAYRLEYGVLGKMPNTDLFLNVENYKSAQQIPKILILKVGGNLNYTNVDSFGEFILKKFTEFHEQNEGKHTSLILDMSNVIRIDPTAAKDFIRLQEYLKKFDCEIYLTDVSPRVYRSFNTNKIFDYIPKIHIFASLTNAVQYLNQSK